MKDNNNKKSLDEAANSAFLQDGLMPPLFANYEGNWTEDFSHENGNYINMCIKCDQEFLGHKRRVICKKCFSNDA